MEVALTFTCRVVFLSDRAVNKLIIQINMVLAVGDQT